MDKIKNFKAPDINWLTAIQFTALGIGGGLFIIFSISITIGIAVMVIALVAGYFINQQQNGNEYAAAKRAYMSYLIQFDTDELEEVIKSTMVSAMTKTIIKEFLLEYRQHEL